MKRYTHTMFSQYLCVCVCICSDTVHTMGQDSAVGIVTRYGLEGPGIESR